MSTLDKYAERIARLYAEGRITDKGLLKSDTAKRIKDSKRPPKPDKPDPPKGKP